MFSRIHLFTYVISCSVMCILSLSDSDKNRSIWIRTRRSILILPRKTHIITKLIIFWKEDQLRWNYPLFLFRFCSCNCYVNIQGLCQTLTKNEVWLFASLLIVAVLGWCEAWDSNPSPAAYKAATLTDWVSFASFFWLDISYILQICLLFFSTIKGIWFYSLYLTPTITVNVFV